MKKFPFLFLLLFISNISIGQVSISPEIGLSYLPFTLTGANTQKESNQINTTIGLSAQLPVHEKFSVFTRISYVDREDVVWRDQCLCPGYVYSEFKHSDLNIDFSILWDKKTWSIGVGPSFTKKFTAYSTVNDLDEDQNTGTNSSENFLGLHGRFSYYLNESFGVHLMYNRIISKMDAYFFPEGRNRLDLTVSYKIKSEK